MNKNHMYERIEALIHEAIHDRLESCVGFKRLEWHDWPGTKVLSGVAADAVFQMLDRMNMLAPVSNQTPPARSPSPKEPEGERDAILRLAPGPIQMLCEERSAPAAPSREDRAYQVLCALLSSPTNASRERFVEASWNYVELMEERGAEKDEGVNQ